MGMNAESAYDLQLVSNFNSGDQSAFIEIMTRHRARVYGAAVSLLRNPADAEEITQDTFIRAHRALPQFRGDSSLATWLHRIAVNLARNRYWYFFRRRKQDTLSLEATLGEDAAGTVADLIATDQADPAHEASRSEFGELIEHCLERLEPSHRRILTMRSVLDQSYEEIAVALGINVGTVKSRIARARERLRALLEQECPDYSARANPSDWFEPSRGSGEIAAA